MVDPDKTLSIPRQLRALPSPRLTQKQYKTPLA